MRMHVNENVNKPLKSIKDKSSCTILFPSKWQFRCAYPIYYHIFLRECARPAEPKLMDSSTS